MKKTPLYLIAALFITGCAVPRMIVPSTVGGSQEVPEEAMRALAVQIETSVANGIRDHSIADYEGIVASTPEIHQAIRTRAARREVLDQFLDTGFAWERTDGMVHIIRDRAYKQADRNRRNKNRDALIVISENDDRWTLYEGLVDANKYDRGSLNTIRAIFAEERFKLLESGQKYEGPDGEPIIR